MFLIKIEIFEFYYIFATILSQSNCCILSSIFLPVETRKKCLIKWNDLNNTMLHLDDQQIAHKSRKS